mmetsp:Transcript_100653/g.270444  ORF Transcript_100653/g.270444 Transcript_100653/m.270444 type:complete len:146 (-) Transcript_100653:668-1105(-)
MWVWPSEDRTAPNCSLHQPHVGVGSADGRMVGGAANSVHKETIKRPWRAPDACQSGYSSSFVGHGIMPSLPHAPPPRKQNGSTACDTPQPAARSRPSVAAPNRGPEKPGEEEELDKQLLDSVLSLWVVDVASEPKSMLAFSKASA